MSREIPEQCDDRVTDPLHLTRKSLHASLLVEEEIPSLLPSWHRLLLRTRKMDSSLQNPNGTALVPAADNEAFVAGSSSTKPRKPKNESYETPYLDKVAHDTMRRTVRKQNPGITFKNENESGMTRHELDVYQVCILEHARASGLYIPHKAYSIKFAFRAETGEWIEDATNSNLAEKEGMVQYVEYILLKQEKCIVPPGDMPASTKYEFTSLHSQKQYLPPTAHPRNAATVIKHFKKFFSGVVCTTQDQIQAALEADGFDYKADAQKLAAVAPTQQDLRAALVLKLKELEVEKTNLEKQLQKLEPEQAAGKKQLQESEPVSNDPEKGRDGSSSDGESTAKGAIPSRDELLAQLAEKTVQLEEKTAECDRLQLLTTPTLSAGPDSHLYDPSQPRQHKDHNMNVHHQALARNNNHAPPGTGGYVPIPQGYPVAAPAPAPYQQLLVAPDDSTLSASEAHDVVDAFVEQLEQQLQGLWLVPSPMDPSRCYNPEIISAFAHQIVELRRRRRRNGAGGGETA